MLQRATVVEVKDKYAVIEISRRSMCAGCEKNGDCGGHCDISGIIASDNKTRAEAMNQIGAKVGDVVEADMAESDVLKYAAVVFILPIAVCALFYLACGRIFPSYEPAAYIGGAAGFVLSFVGIAAFDRKRRKAHKVDITLVKIVSRKNDENI